MVVGSKTDGLRDVSDGLVSVKGQGTRNGNAVGMQIVNKGLVENGFETPAKVGLAIMKPQHRLSKSAPRNAG